MEWDWIGCVWTPQVEVILTGIITPAPNTKINFAGALEKNLYVISVVGLLHREGEHFFKHVAVVITNGRNHMQKHEHLSEYNFYLPCGF